jgi:hypothetical protein
MSVARIRAAFESSLATWAASKVLPVVWQNVGAGNMTGDHLRAYLLPAQTLSMDIAGEHRGYRGVFQVSIFTKPGIGANRAESLARELDELFPVAKRMLSAGVTVQIMTPMATRPAVSETDWFHLPVDCRYAADEVIA